MNDNRQWASDEQYQDDVYDTVNEQLSNGQWIKVRQKPPMQFATMADDFGLMEIREVMEQGNVSEEEAMEETDSSVDDMLQFYREIVVPCVVRPKNAHWANPPDDPNATEVFDISSLNEEDLSTLMESIMSDDGEPVADETGTYQGRFPGQ